MTTAALACVELPAAGAAFADHLLNWLSESFGEGVWRKEAAFASGNTDEESKWRFIVPPQPPVWTGAPTHSQKPIMRPSLN